MALPTITTREKAVLVSLADPDVQLRPGLQVNVFFTQADQAVVEESDAIVGEQATRIIVRGLRDTEMAGFAGQGQHHLFLECGRQSVRKIKRGSWETLPWMTKQYVGAWVFFCSSGTPLECSSAEDEGDDLEDDADDDKLDNPLPPAAPSGDEPDDEDEEPTVDPLASS